MSTSIITNFVTTRLKRGDVLNPTQYMSFVSMIQGMMSDINAFNTSVTNLNSHVINYNDPHDTAAFLFSDVIQHVYNIYVEMTPNPLSLSDFNTYMVPSVDFLELTRRILINRYLYNQVKNSDGSVSSNLLTVNIGEDWGVLNTPLGTTTVGFTDGITNETGFIESGWNGALPTYNYIFDATFPIITQSSDVVLFSTSSVDPYFNPTDVGNGYTQSINPSGIPINAYVRTVFTTFQQTNILQFTNSHGTITLAMNADQSISVLYSDPTTNQFDLVTGSLYTYDGLIWITLTSQGGVQVATTSGTFYYDNQYGIVNIMKGKISSVVVLLPLEDLSYEFNGNSLQTISGLFITTDSGKFINVSPKNRFAIRELVVKDGFKDVISNSITLQSSQNYQYDSNGNQLYNSGGTPVVVSVSGNPTITTQYANYYNLTTQSGLGLSTDSGEYIQTDH